MHPHPHCFIARQPFSLSIFRNNQREPEKNIPIIIRMNKADSVGFRALSPH
jgi:hypothetical protein